jgi:cob(I)alamin adenosyltransferase
MAERVNAKQGYEMGSSTTGSGDTGTTSLMFGHRTPKNSPRPEAYGTMDEANSALGLARGFLADQELKRIILKIQENLVHLNAELACLPQDIPRLKTRITGEHVGELEKLNGHYESLTDMPAQFVPPGGSPASGALDLARSIVRRGERRVAGLVEAGEVDNPSIQSYCNRLADLLFTLARHADQEENL